MRRLPVEAKDDFLEGLVRDPVTGLVELVWNALDADATEVSITIIDNGAEGVAAVEVKDNGTGMTPAEAERGFGSLGGSWKSVATETKAGRSLHGRKGRGRYAAYGVGDHVIWQSVAEEDGVRTRIRLSGFRSDLKAFEVGDPEASTDDTGTLVRIAMPTQAAQTRLINPKVKEELTAAFALYLKQYEQVTIKWQGSAVEPNRLIEREAPYSLGTFEDAEATLTVIEWKFSRAPRVIYLCDEHGMTVGEAPAEVLARGFTYTAYVKWQPLRHLRHDWMLADLGGGPAAPVLEAARARLRTHFQQREGERRKEVIQEWRSEDVYPFKEEPRTETDSITRETFDVVALAASKVINESKPTGKKLALALIREATETSPSALRRVLEDVIGLSQEQLTEFDELLNRTSLSNMLRASRVIGDRLDFLALLDTIIWEKEPRKATLERNHLHRLLEKEPWIFGEEWSVSTSDRRLSHVLRAHLSLLGEDVSAAEDPNDPVLLSDGRNGRPDLVLWRAAEVHQNRLEHLVVELKRPSKKLGATEVQQIEMYADAVVEDNRFDRQTTHWEFWLIGDEVDSYVAKRRNQSTTELGVIQKTGQYTILVKLWSEVQRDAFHRHKFVQRNLEWEASRDHSVARMRQKYADMLPHVLLEAASDTAAPSEPGAGS